MGVVIHRGLESGIRCSDRWPFPRLHREVGIGGVEGQVSTVGGASAVESREKGSGGIIKLKREPDRKGEGLPEPELGLKEALGDVGIDVPEIKYQQKRSFNGKADDDSSSNGIFKMKRGIGKPLGFE